MRATHFLLGAGAALARAASSSGQPVSSCPANNQLCFSVSVPSSSASSGSGDIFFQIQAPSSYEWAALGQGTEMAGSNIFMIYADSAQTNVTLSPRLGTGEVEPQQDNSAQVELLEGSGISNGMMTANVRCANCATWSGGSMSLTDASSSWIWAYKSGAAVASDDAGADIPIHDDMGTMQLDLTKAAGGSDSVNPFVSSDGVATTATNTPEASSSSATPSYSNLSTATAAHGVVMAITMLVLFPCGAMLRRVAPRVSIWAHAGVQSVALLATIAAAGLGIYIGMATKKSGSGHALLGIAVTVLMILQPVWGLLQHRHFRRTQSRGAFSWVHRALGAVAIVLGMVNGGLGVMLADSVGTPAGNAYILIAAVLGTVYGTTYVALALSKRSAAAATDAALRDRNIRHKVNTEGTDPYAANNPRFNPVYASRGQPRYNGRA